ncbi:unnamed protein product [Effrenium voratum]|nr:unnamed protein product [Effrenium voratum]
MRMSYSMDPVGSARSCADGHPRSSCPLSTASEDFQAMSQGPLPPVDAEEEPDTLGGREVELLCQKAQCLVRQIGAQAGFEIAGARGSARSSPCRKVSPPAASPCTPTGRSSDAWQARFSPAQGLTDCSAAHLGPFEDFSELKGRLSQVEQALQHMCQGAPGCKNEVLNLRGRMQTVESEVADVRAELREALHGATLAVVCITLSLSPAGLQLLAGFPQSGVVTRLSSGTAQHWNPWKRQIDYTKLPLSRPLNLEPKPAEEPEAPLKKAAELAANPVGQSLLAALPPPKVTLGKEGTSSIRLDLSEVIKPPREKSYAPVEGLLRPEDYKDQDEEAADVPANVFNHPMFSTHVVQPDGPSADDLVELRKPQKFVELNADDMKDPDWYMKDQISGGPGYLTKKRVSDDVSMYDGQGWKQTTHANPSRVQKRKHQINWLATEAMEKEAEYLERGSQKIQSKAQTHAKYGW